MKPAYIYALVDPNTEEVRYVGKTVNLEWRLRDHCNGSNNCNNPHKSRWIAKLKAAGKKPIMTILQECDGDAWEGAECHWIAHYRSMGAQLTNILSGGRSGRDFQPRARKRVAHKEEMFLIKRFSVKKKEYNFVNELGGGTREGRVLVLRKAIAALKREIEREQKRAKAKKKESNE